eukprot:scaffold15072_cov68-Phaeocystis_antarctica.AAC.12
MSVRRSGGDGTDGRRGRCSAARRGGGGRGCCVGVSARRECCLCTAPPHAHLTVQSPHRRTGAGAKAGRARGGRGAGVGRTCSRADATAEAISSRPAQCTATSSPTLPSASRCVTSSSSSRAEPRA